MISTSSAISIKIIIDLMYLSILVLTYFWPIFTFDDDYDVGLISLKYKFHSNGLASYVKASYKEFDQHLCKSWFDDTKKVCDKLEDFKLAGLLYLIFTAFGGILVAYGILNLIGKLFHFTARGCLHMDFTHYLNPAITSISLGVYCLIVKMYDINYELHIGLFSMFFLVFLALTGFIFYCVHKKSINYATGEYARSVEKDNFLRKNQKSKESELEVSKNSVIK